MFDQPPLQPLRLEVPTRRSVELDLPVRLSSIKSGGSMKSALAWVSVGIVVLVRHGVAQVFPSPHQDPDVTALQAGHDDRARELLRAGAPKFLEASPGRDLPIDVSYARFRFQVWPKV